MIVKLTAYIELDTTNLPPGTNISTPILRLLNTKYLEVLHPQTRDILRVPIRATCEVDEDPED